MLALKARCMEEGDSMIGGEEVEGLKDGRLPVRAVFPLGALPSKALNACAAQHSTAQLSLGHTRHQANPSVLRRKSSEHRADPLCHTIAPESS